MRTFTTRTRARYCETHCRYPAPCYFDDLLEIHTWFDDIGKQSFKIRSEVYRVEEEGALVLEGEGYTAHVHIDDDRNPAPLPNDYLEVFKKLSGDGA